MDGSSDPLVACTGLSKHYGEAATRTRALDAVDLSVAAREAVIVTGPSGCGKTTLLSVIAGLLTPDSGICTVAGREIGALSPGAKAAFRAASLGFVFQAFNLLSSLTAVQNASVPLLLAGMTSGAAEGRAAAALRSVGLADRLHHLPAQLSGGQQQRVAVARAIVHQPRVILCDEPTSALDHQAGQQVMALLVAQARALGAALIVVTHDPRVERHADRIVTMEDGRIVGARTRQAA